MLTPIQNVIEINRPPLPIYQSVIEKTRGLAFRTQALGAAMARTQGAPAESQTVTVETS
jgi:translation initiation factor 3 subunit E